MRERELASRTRRMALKTLTSIMKKLTFSVEITILEQLRQWNILEECARIKEKEPPMMVVRMTHWLGRALWR